MKALFNTLLFKHFIIEIIVRKSFYNGGKLVTTWCEIPNHALTVVTVKESFVNILSPLVYKIHSYSQRV